MEYEAGWQLYRPGTGQVFGGSVRTEEWNCGRNAFKEGKCKVRFYFEQHQLFDKIHESKFDVMPYTYCAWTMQGKVIYAGIQIQVGSYSQNN